MLLDTKRLNYTHMNVPNKNFLFLILIIIVCGCKQKSNEGENHDHSASDSIETSGNEALYSEVMKVHDEVMPKMNDIYTLKEELKKKLSTEKTLSEEKKKEIDATISKLDSASESMMIWMRGFRPLPDSLGEEKVREYLETEMEKVKNVREEIQEALESGKGL
jgi:hypothetical protein